MKTTTKLAREGGMEQVKGMTTMDKVVEPKAEKTIKKTKLKKRIKK